MKLPIVASCGVLNPRGNKITEEYKDYIGEGIRSSKGFFGDDCGLLKNVYVISTVSILTPAMIIAAVLDKEKYLGCLLKSVVKIAKTLYNIPDTLECEF